MEYRNAEAPALPIAPSIQPNGWWHIDVQDAAALRASNPTSRTRSSGNSTVLDHD
jgi:hypothetical protein